MNHPLMYAPKDSGPGDAALVPKFITANDVCPKVPMIRKSTLSSTAGVSCVEKSNYEDNDQRQCKGQPQPHKNVANNEQVGFVRICS